MFGEGEVHLAHISSAVKILLIVFGWVFSLYSRTLGVIVYSFSLWLLHESLYFVRWGPFIYIVRQDPLICLLGEACLHVCWSRLVMVSDILGNSLSFMLTVLSLNVLGTSSNKGKGATWLYRIHWRFHILWFCVYYSDIWFWDLNLYVNYLLLGLKHEIVLIMF